MNKQFRKFIPFLMSLVLIEAGCSSQAPASGSPDLDATISAAIAATQAAQYPGGDDSIANSNQVGGVESTPEAVQANEPTSTAVFIEPTSTPVIIESTSTPAIAATSADQDPPLSLPFSDNFDAGLSSEWRVINGKPLVSEGRLTSATGELSMEIGNTSLQNYTLSFDASGEYGNGCGGGYGNDLVIGFSPTQRLSYYNTDFSGRLRWYTFDNNDWVKIDEQDGIDCGHFEIVVFENSYQVRVNGSLGSELVFDPAQGPLLIAIDEGVYIDNLDIR